MSKKKQHHSQKRASPKKSGSYTPLWVKIVAIGCAAVMLGTAVPLTILFIH